MFLKKGILWKQRLHQITETRVHISWARLASFCHLGFISDPLIVSNATMKPMIPKDKKIKSTL